MVLQAKQDATTEKAKKEEVEKEILALEAAAATLEAERDRALDMVRGWQWVVWSGACTLDGSPVDFADSK
jgi:hypothetical protein